MNEALETATKIAAGGVHRTYHIPADVDGRHVPVTFDHSPVTGREIREQAGAPLTDDLARVKHGKPLPENIGLEDTVELEEGEHFLALPSGRAS